MQEVTLTKITIEELQTIIESSVNRVFTAKTKSTQPESDQWFNLDELRNYLPDKPARQTVYGWVHQRLIPYRKGKKRLRFLKSEVDHWLLSEKRRTLFEIQDSIKVPTKKSRASHQKPAR